MHNMSNNNHSIGLIHILDDNAIQKSLISRILATEKIETAGHDSWDDFCISYSAKKSFCLIANHDLYHPSSSKNPPANRLTESSVVPAISALPIENAEIKLPVILYADQPSAHEVVQGIRSGAVDFLEKPICPHSLCTAVRMGIQQCEEIRARESQNAGFRARAAQLTRRERETMALVMKGLSIKQIAASFGIGLQTAAKHRARLLSKMKVSSDAQLVQLLYSRQESRN
ncbi:MAG: hypothetical protein CMJ74_05970 [Planctomycetaceae bacterium]|nr:hypothetical protein [Planctomycetaceae bacterium]|tara:strand:- start:362 stop:1048 length:687 start_codon:yes stop_codon:yes gene_type:complete